VVADLLFCPLNLRRKRVAVRGGRRFAVDTVNVAVEVRVWPPREELDSRSVSMVRSSRRDGAAKKVRGPSLWGLLGRPNPTPELPRSRQVLSGQDQGLHVRHCYPYP
jgi:hypothetical protein